MVRPELTRHDTDLVSLMFGLLFLVTGAIYLTASLASVEVSWRWAAPVGLIALGVIGLVVSLRSGRPTQS